MGPTAIDLYDPDAYVEAVPHALFRRLRRESPVFWQLSGAFLALLEHPDAWRALAADPALLPTAVEEMLRWVTPVHYFRRTATRDVLLRGQRIRAGDRVVLHYTSATFDEEVFAAPERFDVGAAHAAPSSSSLKP